jgi:hypothetical protein
LLPSVEPMVSFPSPSSLPPPRSPGRPFPLRARPCSPSVAPIYPPPPDGAPLSSPSPPAHGPRPPHFGPRAAHPCPAPPPLVCHPLPGPVRPPPAPPLAPRCPPLFSRSGLAAPPARPRCGAHLSVFSTMAWAHDPVPVRASSRFKSRCSHALCRALHRATTHFNSVRVVCCVVRFAPQ